jgi:hypothetical protein
MYLFTRTAQLTGPLRDAGGWAVEVTAFVNAHGGNHVGLWSSTFGQSVGQVTWAMWAESMTDVSTLFATLNADEGYHAVIARGREFLAAPAKDELSRAIYGGPNDTPPPIGAVSTITTAVIDNGKYVEAVGWGADMAALVETLSGHPSQFLLGSSGTFGGVTWLSTETDMAAAQVSGEAVTNDPEYLSRLADIPSLFVPGSGYRWMATRIA